MHEHCKLYSSDTKYKPKGDYSTYGGMKIYQLVRIDI